MAVLNFSFWCLISVVPQCESASCHPSGTYNFEVTPTFLEDLCTCGDNDCHSWYSFCLFLPFLWHFPFVIFSDVVCYFRGSLVSIMTSVWAWWPRNHGLCLAGAGDFFLFPKACKLTLTPTQPPVQWVMGALCSWVGGGVQQLRHEYDYSPSQNVKINKFGVVPPLPTCHHGMHSNSFNLYTLLLFHLIYQDICVLIYMSCMARVIVIIMPYHLWVHTASCTIGTGSVSTDEEYLEWWDDYLSPFLWSGIHELSSLCLLHTVWLGAYTGRFTTLGHNCRR